ncbi:MAG TPA: hypothetical protein PL009_01180 [Flavipsychrobacter sp.]|nr:hypothetical protein [Flavipsychrobacter sp.]
MIISVNTPQYDKVKELILVNINPDTEVLDGNLIVNQEIYYAFSGIGIFSEGEHVSFFNTLCDFVKAKKQQHFYVATLNWSNEIRNDYPILAYKTNDNREIAVNEMNAILYKNKCDETFLIFNEEQDWFHYWNDTVTYAMFVFKHLQDWFIIKDIFGNEVLSEEEVMYELNFFQKDYMSKFNRLIKPRAFFREE